MPSEQRESNRLAWCIVFIVAICVGGPGCSRPELAIPQQAVAPGGLCARDSDCRAGYSCGTDQICCKNTGSTDCRRRCRSLLQKPVDLGVLRGRASLAPASMSVDECVVLCCQGLSDPEIRADGVDVQKPGS
jgi:hypothetical protein